MFALSTASSTLFCPLKILFRPQKSLANPLEYRYQRSRRHYPGVQRAISRPAFTLSRLPSMGRDLSLIPELRTQFNRAFTPQKYAALLSLLEQRSGSRIDFRVAETPVFMWAAQLDELASVGAELTASLMGNPACLAAARRAIPAGYLVAGETAHPNFLTADFALVRDPAGELVPRLVEIQAFPSVYGYQAVLCSAYRDAFGLDQSLATFLGGILGSSLGGIDEAQYWKLLAETILAGHDPENVVLTEIDPLHQKTRPDFDITAARLGIEVVDIRSLAAVGNKLHYRNARGRLVPIHRIYNRAIADELMARGIQLPFDLTHPWDVEWAGHPNWYFLISKFSIPWLSSPSLSNPPVRHFVVPPAVFLGDFLAGPGRTQLAAAGVPLPAGSAPDTAYSELLLKPLFSFAGKGIQFDPIQAQLEQIPAAQRSSFLLQQRMSFVPTIDTPHGLTQAEIRILYLWPDGGNLTPVLSLLRLGRGKMMGVDHNKDREWVGASAAFFPRSSTP